MKGDAIQTTTLPGFTVTTTVRVLEPEPADIMIPGDWRMICDRFDNEEPLRMLDDEPNDCGLIRGVVSALVIEAVMVLLVIAAVWLWRHL